MTIQGDLVIQTAVDLAIEPSEDGKLLYLPVAPGAKGEAITGMVYFELLATNKLDKALVAKELTVSFPGTSLDPIVFPSRDVTIPSQGRRNVGLKAGNDDADAEEIKLEQIPPKLKVSVVFEGLEAPVWRVWDLATHKTVYDFFARPESNPDFGRYIMLPGLHYQGGGSQHFGFDAGVMGKNAEGNLSYSRTGGDTNADQWLWERPIYASADGTVVRAVDGNIDNPHPDQRSFVRKPGQYQSSYRITGVAVSALSGLRSAVAAIGDDGRLRLTAFDQTADGKELTPIAETVASLQASSVSITGLSETSAVTATQAGTGGKLTLWKISPADKTFTKSDELPLTDVAAVRVVTLSSSRVLTVARSVSGTLALKVWAMGFGKFTPTPVGTASGAGIGDFDVVVLNTGRVATAFRNSAGTLEIIMWEVRNQPTGTGVDLVRTGEGVGRGAVQEVSVSRTGYDDQVATAVRTGEGNVKLIVWDLSAEGAVTRNPVDDECGPGSDINLAFWKSSALAAVYRNAEGNLRVLAWEPSREQGTLTLTIDQLYEYVGGSTNAMAIAQVKTAQRTMVTALRTSTGVLKVNLYQFTDSNLINVLYGDEMMSYVHLRYGSIPDGLVAGSPVHKGDEIAKMGHSGKSSGPHLHIHLTKVYPELVQDHDKLRQALEAGEDVGVFRPMQWRNVQVVRKAGAKPDWADNAWSDVDGQGTYFEDYLVWPKIGP